jgi:hypothetical protein
MATEELIVLLDAQTQKLDAKLRASEKRMDEFEGKTTKADKSLFNISKTGKMVGNKFLDLAKGALAVNAAISAMVLLSAKNRKALELLSSQAKTSAEDFQALSFATSQYGVNAEQIADISKDISDKVAEFSIAGTGAFQDYADTLKLTKEEAREAAQEFTTMSSQEVIGKMVSEMEKAGVSASDMTFALESVGNDLSKLQPLFAGNSTELDKLKKRFNDVNDSLQITSVQAEKLKEVSTSFELMTTQIGNASTSISATLAPVMDDFFNDVINVVPDATQTIIDFANSFLDAENISSIAGVNTQIQEAQSRIIDSQKKINDLKKASNSYSKDGGEFNVRAQRQLEEAIESERARTEELNDQLEVLEAQNKALDDARTLKGGSIGGEDGEGVVSGAGTGDQIQAIADRFATEEELLVNKLERELEIIGDNDELKAQLQEEFLDNALERELAFEAEKEKISKDAALKEARIEKNKALTEKKIESQKLALAGRTAQTLLDQGISSQQKLFSIIKDGAASQIEAYGLTAGAKALAELGPIAGPPAAAAYIGWSQVAAGVVRAMPIGGSSGGGGTPSGGASSEAPQQSQQDFQEQTSSLELTDSSSGGSNQQTITFGSDTGDDLVNAIAEALNKGMSEGRFT